MVRTQVEHWEEDITILPLTELSHVTLITARLSFILLLSNLVRENILLLLVVVVMEVVLVRSDQSWLGYKYLLSCLLVRLCDYQTVTPAPG